VQFLAEDVAAFGYGSLKLSICFFESVHIRVQRYEKK